MRINKFNESSELSDYCNGKIKLTPILNIIGNDSSKEWYSIIGKYFYNKAGEDFFKNHHILLDKLKVGSKKDKETSYRMIGIYFITSYLNDKSLKRMFGSPICHSEFGEGFRPKRKYEYCSHFVEVGGEKLHIGYDDRGTSIEVNPNLTPQAVYNIMENLVDRYLDKK